MSVVLYGFWRSTATYRARIALNWKRIDYETRAVDIRDGAQDERAYRGMNAQGRVPWLIDGEVGLGQSLAIIEWLEETRPEPPLLPRDPARRARVRQAAAIIACDVQPLGNIGVLRRLVGQFCADQSATDAWAAHWIVQGFAALEAIAAETDGPYLIGTSVTLADVCLVPQMYNARRFGVDLVEFPRLVAADSALNELPAFVAARPEAQPDAAV